MADYNKLRPSRNKSYLESFPDEIYDLSDNSHIVRFLDALCGESGVGYARKSLMLKRLQTSLSETMFSDLDMVYSYMFGLPRLKVEQYEYQTSELLTWDQQQEMRVKDAHYRSRIDKYMRSFQYGGTKSGVRLAAEAATGYPCKIIEGREYYGARSIDDQTEVVRPLGCRDVADYNEYIVVVMIDGELSEDERYSAYNVTKRIRPVDARITVKTLKELTDDLRIDFLHDIYYETKPVEESSHWWNIVKHVTGRSDWDYSKYPSLWVEPNIKKEAPRQLLVNSQEEQEDFTFMVKSVKASSEHVGFYNRYQTKIFDMFRGREDLMVAQSALSTSSKRKYTASFYGGDSVIAWSYPTAYTPELQSYFTENARAERFWSSDEHETGTEWIEFEFKRILPLNSINLNITKKPVRIIPYCSSALDNNGNKVWKRIQNKDGFNLSYTHRSWGGSSIAGDMVTVSFDFSTIRANAIKIEFERIDIPYRQEVGDSSFDEETFPYSIEASNVSFEYKITSKNDFIPSVYEDPFGNRVDTSLREMDMSKLVDADDITYWVSQPNVTQDAVEYLILDVRKDGKPVRLNFIDIEAVYSGCQLNVYSTENEEPGVWTPYPDVYELKSERVELPSRMVSFLKLEFTQLNSIPYSIAIDNVAVETLSYPYDVANEMSKLDTNTRVLDSTQRLLTTVDGSGYDPGSIYNELGIQDIYQAIDSGIKSPYSDYGNASIALFTSNAYRTDQGQDAFISSIYGDDFNKEVNLAYTRASEIAVDERRIRYRFFEAGEHHYDVNRFTRSYDVAFVVGIRSIKAGFTSSSLLIDSNESFMLSVADGRFIDKNDGWDLVNEERLRPANEDYICSFETINLQSLVPFRSFDFAVNQRPTREMFEHPSNMLFEWHGFNSDVFADEFGVSGTVLEAILANEGASGIESDVKLVRSKSIANAQVDVFPLEDSEWVFECDDAYGESVFAMHYYLPKRKWTTVGTVFNPMPGGGWWSLDYKYRITVPIVGPIARNSSVFVPSIDFDALAEAGITIDDFRDIRLIYFDGVRNVELDCDITDNFELWFNCQDSLLSGEVADGKYHFDTRRFNGSYHIYFGNKQEDTQPGRDYRRVFDEHDFSAYRSTPEEDGTSFDNDGEFVEIVDDYRLSSDCGFITFEINPTQDPVVIPDGELGKAEVRFIFDYEDEDKKVQAYIYENQLTFVILEDEDCFENAFVSKDLDLFSEGLNRRMLIAWGRRGSERVFHDGAERATDLNRRKIDVYIDDEESVYRRLDCIDNVYDELHYNLGKY